MEEIDQLSVENEHLKNQIEMLKAQIDFMQAEMVLLRNQTICFHYPLPPSPYPSYPACTCGTSVSCQIHRWWNPPIVTCGVTTGTYSGSTACLPG